MTIRSVWICLALSLAACARAGGHASAAAEPTRMQLFLLAGQSNMAGRGVVDPRENVPHPRVLMLNRALAWVPAVDPVHYDKPTAAVGPGRGFALTLVARDSTMRIGLVPAAVGGSPISSWEPGALDSATRTHPYDDALVRARAAFRDGTLRAILWHQGESDASPTLSVRYAPRLRALISRFRTDLGVPELPFLIGQLGHFDGRPWTEGMRRIDSVHRAIAATTPKVAFVSSEGLRDKGDSLHFDAASARVLGERYAAAYLTLIEVARINRP
ncbi:MAG: sialate O-acetylesterase [Gemmatimonadaceae bacterium]